MSQAGLDLGLLGGQGLPGAQRRDQCTLSRCPQLSPPPQLLHPQGGPPAGPRSPVCLVHWPVGAANPTVAAIVIVLQCRLPRQPFNHHPKLDQVPTSQGHCGKAGKGPSLVPRSQPPRRPLISRASHLSYCPVNLPSPTAMMPVSNIFPCHPSPLDPSSSPHGACTPHTLPHSTPRIPPALPPVCSPLLHTGPPAGPQVSAPSALPPQEHSVPTKSHQMPLGGFLAARASLSASRSC